jgi:hypothetical protein
MWLIDIKGKNRGIGRASDYEVSVVHDSNTHGIRSWGWMGKEKLLIADSGACRDGVHDFVWKKYLEMADELCYMMNEIEEDGSF